MKKWLFASCFLCLHAVGQQAIYHPQKDLGVLFSDVQMSGIFADSKLFADAIPKKPAKEIVKNYLAIKNNPAIRFSIKLFIEANFDFPKDLPVLNYIQHEQNIVNHINVLWSTLKRRPDANIARSSLLPLPHPYVVPGGRFREMYYWDSYFTMLGLLQSGDTISVENMVSNFAWLIETYGHIPNGNRSYYLSRSQPPFFALMVTLLATAKKEEQVFAQYESVLQKEYDYWMQGTDALAPGKAYRHVVKLQNNAILNRYYDDDNTPRPESYREDVETAGKKIDRMKIPVGIGKTSKKNLVLQTEQLVYKNLRAAAESGWDFSSRWLVNAKDLSTIHTLNFVPVDLNCLMYTLEQALIKAKKLSGAPKQKWQKIEAFSKRRKELIDSLFWDTRASFFVDYNWVTGKQSGIISAAGMYPFYTITASANKTTHAAATLKNLLLKAGGIVTTATSTGQQWDAPNGWAPMQWIAIKSLQQYGDSMLAKEIAHRWIGLNTAVYHQTGKLLEKYNVVDTKAPGGGGEYPTQDGFGWTNGVLIALVKQYGLPTNQ